jgi:hypothetical protein
MEKINIKRVMTWRPFLAMTVQNLLHGIVTV